MDEKLKTEDLVTNHQNLNTEELLDNTHQDNPLPNSLHNTKYLLASDITTKTKGKYVNNTAQLLNDKTSLLYDSKAKPAVPEILPTEDLLRNNEDLDFLKSQQGKPYFQTDKIGLSNNFSRNEDFELQCKTSFLLGETDNKLVNKFNLFYEKRNQENSESLCVSEDRREPEVLIVSPNILKFPLAFPSETVTAPFILKNTYNHAISLQFCFIVKDVLNDIAYKAFPQYGEVFETLENSQAKYSCFKVNSGGLEELKKNEERGFEIELTVPKIKNKEDLFSILQITATYKNKINYIYLPVLGYVELPKLLCLKELYTERANLPLIAIMLKTQVKGQKIKIPFKNYSLKDLEIEFQFERNTALQNKVFISGQLYEVQFICFPFEMVIASHTTGYLELVAKVLRIKQDENYDVLKNKTLIRKVLVAKVKNAHAYYTFFLEACFN